MMAVLLTAFLAATSAFSVPKNDQLEDVDLPPRRILTTASETPTKTKAVLNQKKREDAGLSCGVYPFKDGHDDDLDEIDYTATPASDSSVTVCGDSNTCTMNACRLL